MNNKATPFYKEAVNALDIGLRKYMLAVFSYMSVGLAITAIIAYIVSSSTAMMSVLFGSPMMLLLVALVPFGISLYMTVRISRISAQRAGLLFLIFATCLGVSLSSIFVVYSGQSIASAFVVTSATFLSMVIYGYTTSKDLTGFGSFLMMGLFGIIIASLVNLFMRSSAMMFVISVLGVVIFTGLTAYDTQVIKSYYYEGDTEEASRKKAIFGALQLYLDFVNLFLYILRFIGVRRE